MEYICTTMLSAELWKLMKLFSYLTFGNLYTNNNLLRMVVIIIVSHNLIYYSNHFARQLSYQHWFWRYLRYSSGNHLWYREVTNERANILTTFLKWFRNNEELILVEWASFKKFLKIRIPRITTLLKYSSYSVMHKMTDFSSYQKFCFGVVNGFDIW